MSAIPQINHLTPEEYLAIERQAEYKSEYVDGVMYTMAGAKRKHNLVAARTITKLTNLLEETGCEVYTSDMKVRVPDSTKFHYPDITVVCGEPEFADDEEDVLLNPLVIIEVLSKTTAAYDRGKKFQWYQQIESFLEYLLVAQDEPIIERFVRQPDNNWLYTKIEGLDQSVELTTINCRLELKDIFAKVLA